HVTTLHYVATHDDYAPISPSPSRTTPFLSFFFHCAPPHRDPHSFPTRRSSDLIGRVDYQLTNNHSLFGRWLRETRKQPVGYDLRSEEHTSELQSRFDLVCRLLLEKKKQQQYNVSSAHDIVPLD